MSFKFRRRQKIFPGFYVNFSASGVSTTLGAKGLSVNLNSNGAYLNTGIPGTGIYDRKKITSWNSKEKDTIIENNNIQETDYFIPENLNGEIKSKNASQLTTNGLVNLKETLVAANNELNAIKKEIQKLEKEIKTANNLRIVSKFLIFGFFIKHFDNDLINKKEYLKNLNDQFENCYVDIEIHMDRVLDEKYLKLQFTFDELIKCAKIWDVTNTVENHDNRSHATSNILRKPTKVSYRKLSFLNSKYEAMWFQNQNGSDIYIYPGFAAIFDSNNNFGLLELEELDIGCLPQNFLEEDIVPNDALIIGETWKKVNKNGNPDLRFKDNFKIPIVKYGELKFESETGVYEVFNFSNYSKTEQFADAYFEYLY